MQWERKKYRRCKDCIEQGNPFQRPSRKPYETESKVGASCNLATTVQHIQSSLSTSDLAISNMSPNDQASKRGEDGVTLEESDSFCKEITKKHCQCVTLTSIPY
jgi:hypothetical protein